MIVSMKDLFLIVSTVILFCIGYWCVSGYYLHSDIFSGLIGRTNNQESSTTTTTTATVTKTTTTAITAATTTIDTTNVSDTSTDDPNTYLYITHLSFNDGCRLGNQMFRYASLLGIARHLGRKLVISNGSDLENTFRLRHVITNETINDWEVITETNGLKFNKELMNLPSKNCTIGGYLQSFKYFVSIADELRYEYTFHDSIYSDAAIILQDVRAMFKWSLIVGVHVRRGDFLGEINQYLGYIIPEKSYFIKAFDYMKTTFSGQNITFLIVSDDIPWCNANLVGTNAITAPIASAGVHMAVLAGCDHVIMTSGTYSWWGAWLSGGHVIYFTGYLSKNTTLGNLFSPSDYYPNHWLGLSN